MNNAGFDFSEQAHREWVIVLSGQRIASAYTLKRFDAALQARGLRTGGQDGKVRAIYAITERDGTLRAACAFTIARDEHGALETELRLPLRELALKGGAGPDLDDGAVILARSGTCGTPWHAARMWGGEEADVDTYLLATQSLLRRELGTNSDTAEDRAPTSEASEDPTVSRMSAARARRQAEAEKRILTAAQLDALTTKHRDEVKALQKEIVALRRKLNNSRWTAA